MPWIQKCHTYLIKPTVFSCRFFKYVWPFCYLFVQLKDTYSSFYSDEYYSKVKLTLIFCNLLLFHIYILFHLLLRANASSNSRICNSIRKDSAKMNSLIWCTSLFIMASDFWWRLEPFHRAILGWVLVKFSYSLKPCCNYVCQVSVLSISKKKIDEWNFQTEAYYFANFGRVLILEKSYFIVNNQFACC